MSGVGGSILGSGLFSLARILESKNIRAGRCFMIQPYPFCSRWGGFVEGPKGRGGEEASEYLHDHSLSQAFLAKVGRCCLPWQVTDPFGDVKKLVKG